MAVVSWRQENFFEKREGLAGTFSSSVGGECSEAFIPRFMPHGMNTVDSECSIAFIPLIRIS